MRDKILDWRSLADAEGDGGVIVRNSLWKLPLFVLPCLFFFLVALLGAENFGLRPKAGWELIRWPTAIGMALVIALLVRQLGGRKPQIIIGRRGIFMSRWSKRTIPWEAFREIRVERQSLSLFAFKRLICLYLNNPEAYPRETWRGWGLGRGLNFGFGDITMMTAGLDHPIEDVWEAIERYAPDGIKLDGAKLGGPWRRAGAPP